LPSLVAAKRLARDRLCLASLGSSQLRKAEPSLAFLGSPNKITLPGADEEIAGIGKAGRKDEG